MIKQGGKQGKSSKSAGTEALRRRRLEPGQGALGETPRHPIPLAVMDAFGEQSEPNGLGEVDTPLIVITIGRLSPETPMADVHLHTADHQPRRGARELHCNWTPTSGTVTSVRPRHHSGCALTAIGSADRGKRSGTRLWSGDGQRPALSIDPRPERGPALAAPFPNHRVLRRSRMPASLTSC